MEYIYIYIYILQIFILPMNFKGGSLMSQPIENMLLFSTPYILTEDEIQRERSIL